MFVNDLYKAFDEIDVKYYYTESFGNQNQRRTQYPEQSFSAELYHQFRIIMEKEDRRNDYNELILHHDILKASRGMKPDLVLHGGQNTNHAQRLFVEIKINPSSSLTKDIGKIIESLEPMGLSFENSVLIVINKSLASTKEAIRRNINVMPENSYLFHSIKNAENQKENFAARFSDLETNIKDELLQ